jgi:hypothetical protein
LPGLTTGPLRTDTFEQDAVTSNMQADATTNEAVLLNDMFDPSHCLHENLD